MHRSSTGTWRRSNTDNRGFTLVELLIASTIFLIVISMALAIFTSQARLNSLATAQSLTRDQVNLTMQLLGNELSLVGQTISFTDARRVSSVAFEVCPEVYYNATSTVQSCLEVTDEATGPIVRFAYADSLEPDVTQACRVASYRLEGNSLQRANVPCFSDPTDPTQDVAFNFAESDYVTIIGDVVAFDIDMVCSDGTTLPTYPVGTSSQCNISGAYPRAIRFAVVARSGTTATRPAYTFSPPWFSAADPPLASCGDRQVCFGLAQEFTMPNMNKER